MAYQPTTNFRDSNGTDLGKKFISKDYVATVYPGLIQGYAGLIGNRAELYLWGNNPQGSIGDNTIASRSTPRQEFTSSAIWKQISCGGSSTTPFVSAIKSDGTLWTWGRNDLGQVGDNTLVSRSTPRQISIAAAGGLTGWKQVDSGSGHTAAIRDDGTLWVWGYNNRGQIGDNTATIRSTPRQISLAAAGGLNGWKQVSAGDSLTSALRYDGTLWCWGYNNFGQIGDNTLVTRSTPTQEFTSSTNWKQVSAGGSHTAAIKTNGTLWSWGSNNYGQIGDNTGALSGVTSRSTPRQESTLSANWKQVDCGASHTAAIKTNGTLWSWGLGNSGELGDYIIAFSRSTPIQEFTASNNWKQVSGGISFTAAIKTDGTLWTWGSNTSGQIGDNTIASRSTPRQEFTSSTTWRQVSASVTTAAIKFPVGE
jgi:alpha-tubulin suppressor-like RCC1 family protein